MKKILVIGSNSFSGSCFINHLLDKTEYDILGISRSPEKNSIYLPYKSKNSTRFEFHQLDLNNNLPAISSLIEKNKPEYIVNFASQSMVGESWQHPDHWYCTNVLSIVKLTNKLKEMNFLKKYVHISTPEVYGSCSGLVKEDAPFNPSTPYAASRAAADVFIQMLVKTFNFPAVFTRAANVYGPGQQLFKIIPRAVVFIKKGIKIPLHGGGIARRSFIHITDVCNATVQIMENAKPGEIYHISTEKLYSIRNIVDFICQKMNMEFDKVTTITETRLGLDDAYILDSSKAKNEFGWKAQISIDKGVGEVIDWIDKFWSTILTEPLEYVHKE